jgi:protein phosphatase
VTLGWEVAARSDVGRVRRRNEDSFVTEAERGVFLVADGMGGHRAGDVASALAAGAAREVLTRAADEGARGEAIDEALQLAFDVAQERIARASAADARTQGMGTTLTACVLEPDGSGFHLGHVGDSRAYLWSGGVLRQLTHDHTWVQAQVAAGRLSPALARTHDYAHVLTRVLIGNAREVPDLVHGPLVPGDLLLLATDGLTGMLDDDALAELLAQPLPLDEIADELIARANAAGGVDNATAVVIRIRS